MSLEAEVTRLQLNSLPKALSERLLERSDIVASAETGAAEIGGFGAFSFADLREALASTDAGTITCAPVTPGQSPIEVLRAPDGSFTARNTAGEVAELPELALLDPSMSLRQGGLRIISDRGRSRWPTAAHWESVIAERVLDDSEFGKVLAEIQSMADHRILVAEEAVQKGRFGPLDIVPTDRTYYESLVGPMPVGLDPVEFLRSRFVPVLRDALAKDVDWGLTCIRVSNLNELIDPVALCMEIPDEVLLSSLERLGLGNSPQSVLSTYLLASHRSASDPGFDVMASEALGLILEHASKDEQELEVGGLFVALMGLALSVIGQAEDICLAPAYWRRLAACAHAALLVDRIDFSGWDFSALAKWCDELRSHDTGAMEILDLVREPAWRPDIQRGKSLWVSATIRAIGWDRDKAALSMPLTEEQRALVDRLSEEMVITAGLPDPLMGRRRRRQGQAFPSIGLELLTALEIREGSDRARAEALVWNGLVHGSRIYSFTDELLSKIRERARDALRATGTTNGGPDVLVSMCEIASIQADLALADAVVNGLLLRAPRFRSAAEVAEAAAAIVIASGVSANWAESLRWAEDQLVALAFALPKGACSVKLAQTIELLQKFIPLGERRWCRARAIARSAAD